MPTTHEPLLVNIIGHSVGTLLFGIFLFLVLQDRAGARLRGSWLSVTAAGLACLWNAGSLLVLTVLRASLLADLVTAVSFSALSLLPAVLLHLAVKGRFRPILATGYALSAVTVAMHFRELFRSGPGYHQTALLLITVGFIILTGAAVVALLHSGRPETRSVGSRAVGTMCLSLFAISFTHLGVAHGQAAWSRELAFHHAGIPLALFVLLQDYRFVLLDAFIRLMANVLLAALLTLLLIRALSSTLVRGIRGGSLDEVVLFAVVCLLCIVFASLRRPVQVWLTRVVFGRSDLEAVLQRARTYPVEGGEASYFSWITAEMARYMEADRAEQARASEVTGEVEAGESAFPALVSDFPRLRSSSKWEWVEAVVPVRSAAEVNYILLGRRKGGRRYLSEDLRALARLAGATAERLESLRTAEMQRLVSQAEFRALQSQINPHFLFNALNTLYGVIPRSASGARRTVLHLAEIFRYFLQTDKKLIRLSDELEIVKAYLEIESLRFGPRLQVEIDVDESALALMIPVLSIEPLVENAVKHGVAASSKPEWVRLKVRPHEDRIVIRVENTRSGITGPPLEPAAAGAGVGLANVTRRLRLCYGPESGLAMEFKAEETVVEFSVPSNRFAMAG